jgi:hypothetical protein
MPVGVDITVKPGPTAAPWTNVASDPVRAQSADGILHEFPAGTDPSVIDKVMKDYHAPQSAVAPVPKQGQTIQPTNIPADIAATRGKAESIAGQATGVSEASDVLKGKETPEEQQKFAIEGGLTAALGLGGLALKGAGVIGASRLAGTQWGKQMLRPLEKFLSPSTVSPEAEAAAGTIRKATGTAARDYAITAHDVEPYHALVNALPDPDKQGLVNYIEGHSTNLNLFGPQSKQAGPLRALADTLRDNLDQRKQKLLNLPKTAQMDFVENYLPHMWKDPGQAQQAFRNFAIGTGKQGSAASLKKRTVPTYAEGLAMGLQPATNDPIEMTLRYTRSMDNFIASQEALDTGVTTGNVRYFKQPTAMGASGHPSSMGHNVAPSGPIPDGWVPLNGRGSVNAQGQQAYAPEDWARVYNNYIDRGVHKSADWGKVYDTLQHGSNAITSMELGLSGYHAITMAKEAIISDFANGLQNVIGGRVGKGLSTIARSPVAPFRMAAAGKKVEQAYLSRTAGTPDLRRVLDVAEKAGMRGVGRGHAPDYSMSAMGNYWTSFKRGALKQEITQSWQNAKSGPVGAFKEVTSNVGRAMQTVAAPIFETYIPRLKNAAVYETLHDWMEMHPNATFDEQVAEARNIIDAMDDRFGEMIQDNIFWNKTMKQMSQLVLRSYSWDMGTLRLLGGVRDLARGKLTRKAEYAIAMPIVSGTIAAIYMKLKTSKDPEQWSDLVFPQTGGTTSGSAPDRSQQYYTRRGQRVPQKARLAGYEGDYAGWIHDPQQEALNKLATGPRMVLQPLLSGGKDSRGFPIAPEADWLPWLADYLKYVGESVTPISIKNLEKPQYPGTNLGGIEQFMGVREAPVYAEDPTGYARTTTAIQRRAKQNQENYEKKQEDLKKQSYGGSNE